MSKVDICNDALGYIGKQDINSLLDAEPAARQCRKFLPRTLRELQARYDWEHNLTAVDISKQADPSKLPGFKYAHMLPVDYLRFSCVTRVEESDNNMLDATFSPDNENTMSYDARHIRDKLRRNAPVAMKIADGFIHTNFTPVRLVYHRHVTGTDNLPELFRAAVVAQLAAKLVFPLTRDTKLTGDIREMAANAISFAQDTEDQDEHNECPEGSSFEDARR